MTNATGDPPIHLGPNSAWLYQSPALFMKILATTPEAPVKCSRLSGFLDTFLWQRWPVPPLPVFSPTGESLRVDLLGSMKAGEAASGMGRNRKHGFLVSAQVAMSMTLLLGASLFSCC